MLQQGFLLVLIVVLVAGALGGALYFMRRQWGQGNVKRAPERRQSGLPTTVMAMKRTPPGDASLLGRVQVLEEGFGDMLQRLQRIESEKSLGARDSEKRWFADSVLARTVMTGDAPILRSFLKELADLLNTRGGARGESPNTFAPREEGISSRRFHGGGVRTSGATMQESNASGRSSRLPLNDLNLIHWWIEKGNIEDASQMQGSLAEWFGDVTVTEVSVSGKRSNLVGVALPGGEYMVFPRKLTGWDPSMHKQWFDLMEGEASTGMPIRELRSPLPRARKTGAGFELTSAKGKVSVSA